MEGVRAMVSEDKVLSIGEGLLRAMRAERGSILSRARWESEILAWCMRSEAAKVRLLRLVDVLPALRSGAEVVRHLREYFPRDEAGIPGPLRLAIGAGALWKGVARTATNFVAGQMAKRFIAGRDVVELLGATQDLRDDGAALTLDLLGEHVHSDAEADAYAKAYLDLIDGIAGAKLADPNVSIKGTSLDPSFEPADPEGTSARVRARLRPILERAVERGVFVNLDIESFATRDVAIRALQDLLSEDAFRKVVRVGTVVQTYLCDAEAHLRRLIEWVRRRGAEITVRLVKGAYWDYEVAIAGAREWPAPVFTRKEDTDACYERCLEILFEHGDAVRTAIASHNARSIAYALALAESREIPKDRYEFQVLFGMGTPIAKALIRRGTPVRAYVPYGELIPGMGYLVRRILENTANESFLRVGLDSDADPRQILRRPEAASAPPSPPPALAPMPPFRNVAPLDFSREREIAAMREAIAGVRGRLPLDVRPLIAGERIETGRSGVSTNPADPSEVIARVSLAERAHVDAAVGAAHEAWQGWRRVSATDRARILFRAAEIIEKRRREFAALAVLEAGKIWYEADGDVAEAIDFLSYYGCEALRLDGRTPLPSPRGEENVYEYRPLGVIAVIAPWNFPASILTGMLSAAIAAGNAVVAKPAGSTPAIASELCDALADAGLPAGVLNLLTGAGSEIGDALIVDPRVRGIAFTGSREVGLRILRRTAEEPGQGPKRAILEMGGKNAIIVAADADLDEAVGGIIASAFGYQGQKCSAASRVIAVDEVYDALARRVVEATRSLRIGPPDQPGFPLGPVIAEDARVRIRAAIEKGKGEAKVLYEGETPALPGHYVAPVVFGDVPPESTLGQEEIFGPVIAMIRAQDLDDAIRILNGTSYALTGGIFSRSPADIEKAKRECEVGNFYINRKITAAIVSRQPFGGFKMSGIGSKAGGPDYLRQFLTPVTITENTMRRGFAPEAPEMPEGDGSGAA
ncbi:MAG: proline dehydrogenase family protein [Planctomycetes bacterium]|nr:proline dehydrogenase family protein [Planctomycetota bacterium]